MATSPTRLAGGLLIEVGGILLALTLLPVVPWERWKELLAPKQEAAALQDLQGFIPEARYAFQHNGQPRPLEERRYTVPFNSQPPATRPPSIPAPADMAPSLPPRTAATPPDRLADSRLRRDQLSNPSPYAAPAPADSYYTPRPVRPTTPPPAELSAVPPTSDPTDRREYVAETLDRASQRMLDSLLGSAPDAAPQPSQVPAPVVPSPYSLPQSVQTTPAPATVTPPPITLPPPPLEPSRIEPPGVYAPSQSYGRPIAPPSIPAPSFTAPPANPLPNMPDSYPQPSNRFQPMLDQLEAGQTTSPAPQPSTSLPYSQQRQHLPRDVHY